MINKILQDIRSTTKRTEKMDILKSVIGTDNEYLFKRVAFLTYDPSVKFYIKDIDFNVENDEDTLFDEPKEDITLNKALDVLQYQIARDKLRGHAARDLIIATHSRLSSDDKDVFECVIDGDLKCGASAKTINKVWPNLIYIHPYMRASSFNKKNLSRISFPAISETKEDGGYEDIIIKPNDKIEVRSRNGSILNHYLNANFIKALQKNIDSDVVLMGEVLVTTDNTRKEIMNREDGNGYLNSNDVDPDRLIHVVWDIVPYEDFLEDQSKTEYKHRLDMLKRVVNDLRKDTDQIRIIDNRIVNSVDEVIAHFKENVEKGLEGTVIKNQNMKWKNGDSKDQVKVKIVFDCDLKIVGFNQGKRGGKPAEIVGSIICETSDSKLEVSVSGLTEEFAKHLWQHKLEYMKTIISVKANDVITNEKNPEKYSLFLPRFDKVRNDKTKADTLERVIEQRNAFVETLREIEG